MRTSIIFRILMVLSHWDGNTCIDRSHHEDTNEGVFRKALGENTPCRSFYSWKYLPSTCTTSEAFIRDNFKGDSIKVRKSEMQKIIEYIPFDTDNEPICLLQPKDHQVEVLASTQQRKRDPPTTQADTAVARSSRLRVASRAQRTRAAKIR